MRRRPRDCPASCWASSSRGPLPCQRTKLHDLREAAVVDGRRAASATPPSLRSSRRITAEGDDGEPANTIVVVEAVGSRRCRGSKRRPSPAETIDAVGPRRPGGASHSLLPDDGLRPPRRSTEIATTSSADAAIATDGPAIGRRCVGKIRTGTAEETRQRRAEEVRWIISFDPLFDVSCFCLSTRARRRRFLRWETRSVGVRKTAKEHLAIKSNYLAINNRFNLAPFLGCSPTLKFSTCHSLLPSTNLHQRSHH